MITVVNPSFGRGRKYMKKKLVGIFLLMLMTTPVISAFSIRDSVTIQEKPFDTTRYQPILLNWGVDQEQIENCGHGIILAHPLTYAQSFTPTKEKLTAVRLHIFRYGAPPEITQITVSIRDNLTNPDLATKTIDTSEITFKETGTWVLFNFQDISVTPGNTYFIVCSGNNGDENNAYCWFYNNENTYSGGQAWIKPDEYSIWTNFTHGGFNPDDFCFKTYFRKPFGGFIPDNKELKMPNIYHRPSFLFRVESIKSFLTVLLDLKNF
jgi:hypothetical protein